MHASNGSARDGNLIFLQIYLKVGFEGVRHEADTDTYVRLHRGPDGAKNTIRTH